MNAVKQMQLERATRKQCAFLTTATPAVDKFESSRFFVFTFSSNQIQDLINAFDKLNTNSRPNDVISVVSPCRTSIRFVFFSYCFDTFTLDGPAM